MTTTKIQTALVTQGLRDQIAAQLEKSKQADKKIAETLKTTTKVAIVRQAMFYHSPACPHCGSMRYPEAKLVLQEEPKAPSKVIRLNGDIVVCCDCNQVILVLLYPIITSPTPIFLYIDMKGKEGEEVGESKEADKEAGASASDPAGSVTSGVQQDEGVSS